MVKFCRIKPNHPKVFSMMITVTDNTLLAFYFRRGMVAFLDSNPILNFGMANQAFFTRYFISKNMALGTI